MLVLKGGLIEKVYANHCLAFLFALSIRTDV